MDNPTKKAVLVTDGDSALSYIREYARDHLYFNGGMVLVDWRKTGDPVAQQDWSNKWGAVISKAAYIGILTKAGRMKPSNTQSHSKSLVRWQSRVYTGPEQKQETAVTFLINLQTDVMFDKKSLADALQEAYELGFESAENE